jgi:hypothetical protein
MATMSNPFGVLPAGLLPYVDAVRTVVRKENQAFHRD